MFLLSEEVHKRKPWNVFSLAVVNNEPW
jgi:hypothetical protein